MQPYKDSSILLSPVNLNPRDMSDLLRHKMEEKVGISDEEFESFSGHLKTITLQKKEYVLEEGKACGWYFFIDEGLLRTYYVDENGKEVITAFAIEGWWVTELDSFINQQPSRQYIQALEPTTVRAIRREDLEKMYTEIPVLNEYFRIVYQNMLIALQRRMNFYLKKMGEDRYDSVVKGLPGFIQRIPQHMLASYLNITPEYLSKLRKK